MLKRGQAMNFEVLIPLLGGVYVLLMARGIVPVGKDPGRAEQWRKRWGLPFIGVRQ